MLASVTPSATGASSLPEKVTESTVCSADGPALEVAITLIGVTVKAYVGAAADIDAGSVKVSAGDRATIASYTGGAAGGFAGCSGGCGKLTTSVASASRIADAGDRMTRRAFLLLIHRASTLDFFRRHGFHGGLPNWTLVSD